MQGNDTRVYTADNNDEEIVDVMAPTAGTEGLTRFLQFREPNLGREFNIYQKRDMNIALSFIIGSSITIYATIYLRYLEIWRNPSPLYLCAFLSSIINLFTSAALICLRAALLTPTSTFQSYPLLKRIHKVLLVWDQSPALWVILNTSFVISLSIGNSLFLLARILRGPCSPDNMDWRAQLSCNNASLSGLPFEQYVVNLLTVLMVQILLKGANRKSLLVAWVAKFVIVMVCVKVAGATTYVWVCFHFSLAMGISYEVSG
jgi:hypothetical protein